jgi:hypothetical protein
MTKDQGIQLINCGAEDLEAKNEKITLGLVWKLILVYQINKVEEEEETTNNNSTEEIKKDDTTQNKTENKKADTKKKNKSAENTKKELLEWVKSVVDPYNVEAKNFTTSWQSGKCLFILYKSIEGNSVDIEELNKKEAIILNQEAIEGAESNLGIPALISADDITNYPGKIFNKIKKIDELAILTYLSYYKALASKGVGYKLSEEDFLKLLQEEEEFKQLYEKEKKELEELQKKFEEEEKRFEMEMNEEKNKILEEENKMKEEEEKLKQLIEEDLKKKVIFFKIKLK